MPLLQPGSLSLKVCSVLMLLFASLLPMQTHACSPGSKPALEFAYRVIDEKPHRRSAFTQGLLIDQGILYESSGGFGNSSLSLINLDSGKLLSSLTLERHYFAEGLTLLKGKLYQLTWWAETAFVYDAKTLEKIRDFRYQGEGWGLTHDGQQLIMSNGSNRLIFRDPLTFKELKTLEVCEGDKPVTNLNELEWVDSHHGGGSIYANIWQNNWLVIIDPRNGQITGKVDLSELLPAQEREADTDVLNGIAYDATHNALWVTGKRWPRLYRIELYSKPHTEPKSQTPTKLTP